MNFPFIILLTKFPYSSKFTTSVTFSINFFMSPIPNNLLMKLSGSNFSRSSNYSPVPIKVIGLSVAATAERAPPPFACPSNFVIITLPTFTHDLKALA